MKTRTRNLVIPVTEEEMDRMHALSEAGDEPITRIVRRWLNEGYQERFGTKRPPAARLRPGPRAYRNEA